jgi:hypothetical protein
LVSLFSEESDCASEVQHLVRWIEQGQGFHTGLLSSIVKNDPEGVPFSAAQPADTVPHVDAIDSPCSLDGAVVNGKGNGVSLTKANNLRPGLHPGTLLRKNKLAAREIPLGLRQKDSNLYRESVFAVKILMEAVVVAFAVLQQQRRWLRLPGAVAAFQEIAMPLRILHVDLHREIPSVGNGRQFRIKALAQFLDEVR